jgi:MFS transporter, ACDE family, multidrug resistance protein
MTKVFNRNLFIIFSITIVAILGVASIAPALPMMTEALKIPAEKASLVITAFTLPGVVLTPLFGILADRYGRKIVLLPSLILFAVAGTACGMVNDFRLLLILRFFQGVSASSLGSLNVTLIGDLFHGRERFAAMGYNATVLSMGTALYPALGGGLALLGWNWPFFLSLVAVVPIVGVIFFFDAPFERRSESIGSYLLESVKLLKNRRLLGLVFATLSTFIMLYGVLLAYLPFYLKEKFGASTLMTGIVISSSSFASALVAMNLKKLTEIIRPSYLLVAAFILYGISFITVFPMDHLYLVVIPVLFYGAASGINMPNVQAQLTEIAPAQYRAGLMSINGMVLRIGQTVGPLLSAGAFALYGFHGVLLGGVFFALLSAIILVFTVVRGEEEGAL